MWSYFQIPTLIYHGNQITRPAASFAEGSTGGVNVYIHPSGLYWLPVDFLLLVCLRTTGNISFVVIFGSSLHFAEFGKQYVSVKIEGYGICRGENIWDKGYI